MKKKFLLPLLLVVTLLLASVMIFSVSADECSAGGSHNAPIPPTCTTGRICLKCFQEVEPAAGHAWDDATCAAPKTCRTCGDTEGKKLPHDPANYDREEPTCTEPVKCTACNRDVIAAKGHTEGDPADCGHAQWCSECSALLANATGEHDFTGLGEVIKAPTAAGGYGECLVSCATCGEQILQHFTNRAASSDSKASTVGGTAQLSLQSYLTMKALKVANYSGVALGGGYKLLQVADITLYDAEDEAYQPNGTLQVKMLLNKSAVKFDAEDLKVYHIGENGKATELTVISVEDGYITFETSHFSVFAVGVEGATGAEVLGSAGSSVGAIIGIVAGAVVVLGGAAVAVLFVLKKKKAGAAK